MYWVTLFLSAAICALINAAYYLAGRKEKSYWVINEGTGNMICDGCKEEAIKHERGWYVTDYCPHCGREMNTDKVKYYTPKKSPEEVTVKPGVKPKGDW